MTDTRYDENLIHISMKNKKCVNMSVNIKYYIITYKSISIYHIYKIKDITSLFVPALRLIKQTDRKLFGRVLANGHCLFNREFARTVSE